MLRVIFFWMIEMSQKIMSIFSCCHSLTPYKNIEKCIVTGAKLNKIYKRVKIQQPLQISVAQIK